MQKIYAFIVLAMLGTAVLAQYPLVNIYDIQYKDDASLSLEDDLSAYDGDTVRVQGIVTFDPCIYALSTSGTRLGTFLSEESATGVWTGLTVLIDYAAIGYSGDLQGLNDEALFIDNFQVGNIVECTGIVSTFDGNTQLLVLPIASEIVGFGTPPAAETASVGDFMQSDGAGGQVMQTVTGEPYENVYVELTNVFVTDVSYTSSSGRWTWYLQDADGNKIRIRDLSGFFRNDTESDDECAIWSGGSAGETATPDEYTAPTAGTYLSYVRGEIIEAFTGTEYTIAPLALSDIGPSLATPPTVTNIVRSPVLATSTENVTVSATITDLDGTVAYADLYYSYGIGNTGFTAVAMTSAGDTYSAAIPGPGIDSTYVNFYIQAVDDEGNSIATPAASSPNIYIVYDDGINSIARLQFSPFTSGTSVWAGDSITANLNIEAIVTASKALYDLNLLIIQDSDQPWSGIKVYSLPGDGTETLVRGDKIRITKAKVMSEAYVAGASYGVTSLRGITYEKLSDMNPLPAFITTLNPTDIDAQIFEYSEPYESMLLKFSNVYETMDNADPGAGDPVYGFGEWKFNTSNTPDQGLRTDDLAYKVFQEFGVDSIDEGDELDYIQGVLDYSFNNYKLLPRDMNDIAGFSTTYPNAITAFNIPALGVNGIVNESALTITLQVPFGTDVTALIPAITYTGQSIEPANGAPTDFSLPVTYTSTSPVTFATKEYVVTVEFIESVSELPGIGNLELFPNPATDKIAVSFDSEAGKNLTLALEDISGHKLLETNYLAHSGKNILPIDLREFANGLYLLQIRSTDKMTTLKITVSK